MALSSVDSYIAAQPEQAEDKPEEVMDWNTFYNQYGRNKYGSQWVDMDPDHWFTKVGNFFTGDINTARNQYDAYLKNLDIMNEYKATQSARDWDKFMDDTKVQRSMKDYEAAGLNPYLLINSGSVGGGSAPTSAKADYKSYSKKEKDQNVRARDVALLLLGVAKLASVLL